MYIKTQFYFLFEIRIQYEKKVNRTYLFAMYLRKRKKRNRIQLIPICRGKKLTRAAFYISGLGNPSVGICQLIALL